MLAAVRKARVVHMVCHNYRRIPAIALAREMIEGGELGDRIYHYRARYAQDWIADPKFPLVWRLQSKIAGSGAHGDINAHIIDLGRYLVGEFREVCAAMETFVKERPVSLGARRKGKVTVDDAVMMIGQISQRRAGQSGSHALRTRKKKQPHHRDQRQRRFALFRSGRNESAAFLQRR